MNNTGKKLGKINYKYTVREERIKKWKGRAIRI